MILFIFSNPIKSKVSEVGPLALLTVTLIYIEFIKEIIGCPQRKNCVFQIQDESSFFMTAFGNS